MRTIAILASLAAAGFATSALATTALAEEKAFKVSVPGMSEGATMHDAQVFNSFGCKGGNRSPALSWTEPPANTKSLAITLFDPDAPTGSGWWHWTVVNLPATQRNLPEGAGDASGSQLPKGAVQGRTDYGISSYGGPCPPPGAPPHRYIFTIWALDTESLPIDANAAGAVVGYYVNAHAVGKATVTFKYGR